MTRNNTSQSRQYEALRAAPAAQRNPWKKYNFPAYIGLDVHENLIKQTEALGFLSNERIRKVRIRTDSQLVASQTNGLWKV